MKHTRLARLALALTPLSLGLAALPPPAPAQAPSAPANGGLPPGAPPLTAAQRQKQQDRIARFQQDFSALKANTSLTNLQKQQQLVAMQQAVDRDMLAILTPVQQAAVLKQRNSVIGLLNQFNQQHRAEFSQQTKIGQQLDKSITPAQRQKMALIQKQAQDSLQKALSDPKATPETKQQLGMAIQRDAVRDQMAVLSPPQQTQFKQLQSLSVRINQERAAFAKAHGQK